MKGGVVLLLWLCMGTGTVNAQLRPAVFAHNDYEKARPLHGAYQLQVDYIEVDIFLEGNALLVAHTKQELNVAHTLDSLYLTPLQHYVNQHPGYVYDDTTKSLALVIDLKTGGKTADVLVAKLKEYPGLLQAKQFQVVISGAVPDRAGWSELPDFLRIDGRPGIVYTAEQLKRIALISSAFPVPWNGRDALRAEARALLIGIREEVHGKGKPLRFWAAPDREETWKELIELGITVINTDDPSALNSFLSRAGR